MKRSLISLTGFALLGFALIMIAVTLAERFILAPQLQRQRELLFNQLTSQVTTSLQMRQQQLHFELRLLSQSGATETQFSQQRQALALTGAARFDQAGELQQLSDEQSSTQQQRTLQALRPAVVLALGSHHPLNAGLINLPQGPHLVSWIQTQPHGLVIGWQAWDRAMTGKLLDAVKLPVSATQLYAADTPDNLRALAAQLQRPQLQNNALLWTLKDIDGHPILLLQADVTPLLELTEPDWRQPTIILLAGLFAFALVTLLAIVRFIRPIEQLLNALHCHSGTDTESLTLIGGSHQVRRLIRAYRELLSKLQHNERRTLSLSHKLEKLSRRDPLTGLPNRNQFDDFIQHEWHRGMQLDTPLAAIGLRLDHMPEIAKVLGPAQTDSLLKSLADTLAGNVHQATDLVARIAPNAFAIVLPDTQLDNAQRVAIKLQELTHSIKQTSSHEPWPTPYTASAVLIDLCAGQEETLEQRVTHWLGALEQLDSSDESLLQLLKH